MFTFGSIVANNNTSYGLQITLNRATFTSITANNNTVAGINLTSSYFVTIQNFNTQGNGSKVLHIVHLICVISEMLICKKALKCLHQVFKHILILNFIRGMNMTEIIMFIRVMGQSNRRQQIVILHQVLHGS